MNKINKVLITVGGILNILLALFHLSFWKAFNWKAELANLSVVNSNIMQMLNIAVCVILLSFGYLLLVNRKEIINTRIGKTILFILSLFYFVRLIMEYVFPDGSIIFGFVLLVYTLIYFIPAVNKTSN